MKNSIEQNITDKILSKNNCDDDLKRFFDPDFQKSYMYSRVLIG